MSEDDLKKPAQKSPVQEMKPWEQRIGPGMGGGGNYTDLSHNEQPEKFERVGCHIDDPDFLKSIIDHQTDMAHLPMVNLHKTPDTDLILKAESNIEVWKYFITEHLYDTRRLTLEHFHLFEWFPVAPGRFHTPQAKESRNEARHMLERDPEGGYYFDPYGKSRMVEGGIGSVRLRPRQIAGEPHYFMTASSSGVCHEGFPVLVPRRFYGPIKQRILKEGAMPVTLSGEMRYIPEEILPFFGKHRDIQRLYLHVDEYKERPAPRDTINEYDVSVAVSFEGNFKGTQGVYITYATFDPASNNSLVEACQWLESFYVEDRYKGVIITDFDEPFPKFPHAVFGLPDLMAGRLDRSRVSEFLQRYYPGAAGQNFFLIYKEINTQGGAYIGGDVNTGGGDFVGRDKIIHRH